MEIISNKIKILIGLMLHIGREGSEERPLSRTKLLESYGLGSRTFESYLQLLQRSGLIRRVMGRAGGYYVSGLESLSLGEVLNRLLAEEEDVRGSRKLYECEVLRGLWAGHKVEVEKYYGRIKLQDLVRESERRLVVRSRDRVGVSLIDLVRELQTNREALSYDI